MSNAWYKADKKWRPLIYLLGQRNWEHKIEQAFHGRLGDSRPICLGWAESQSKPLIGVVLLDCLGDALAAEHRCRSGSDVGLRGPWKFEMRTYRDTLQGLLSVNCYALSQWTRPWLRWMWMDIDAITRAVHKHFPEVVIPDPPWK